MLADVDDQYRQGLYLRETWQPYTAIETLDAILAANPSLNRVRLALAVVYYRTLNDAKDQEHAQRVLDDPKTPEVQVSKIESAVSACLFYADLGWSVGVSPFRAGH